MACLVGIGALGCNALDRGAPTSGTRRVVPTDQRPALEAPVPPPPLSGGTLLVTEDGQRAIVADEARDRVSVVDLGRREWLGEIALPPGSEPGRLAEGTGGDVFVVLRGQASVARLNLADLSVSAEIPVCAEPRGIAYDASRAALHVACLSGRFLTLSPSGEIERSLQLPNDLRDVVVENGRLWVSRFRSAEVLELDAEGRIQKQLAPPIVMRSGATFSSSGLPIPERFKPGVAWRMRANPAAEGGVVLVHQLATTEEIDLEPDLESGASAYGAGGGFGCGGIHRTTVTTITAAGQVKTGPDVPVTLPLDVAVSSAGQAAVIGAGRRDASAPSSFIMSEHGSISSAGLAAVDPNGSSGLASVTLDATDECMFAEPFVFDEDAAAPEQYFVSVAAHPDSQGTYLVQLREPAELVITSSRREPVVIPLGGDSVADTGFDLFHRNAEAGVSCASCHPDGSDDGHVWQFSGQGPRRTQPVDVRLDGTAPFHWDGSLPRLDELMGEVFVGRMGGVHQAAPRLGALSRWLFELGSPAPEPATDDAAVLRGRRLFESLEVGCASCHRGSSFTDNNSYDVGTGEPGEKFQVPSLLGISTRSSFIHDGCASSLRERFELDCAGGDRHGKVSELGGAEIDDVISYLETL